MREAGINYRLHLANETGAIIDCFTETFVHSEGECEGAMIRDLVTGLFATTPDTDLVNLVAADAGRIAGSIFFTRVLCDNDLAAYMLSPVAVRPSFQRQGVGQSLIRHGLRLLQDDYAAAVVVTYGDPDFYSKLGFVPISEQDIRPPYRLTQPEGWLGQSLTDRPINHIKTRLRCVKAFDSPSYW